MHLKRLVKRLLERLVPRQFAVMQTIRARRHIARLQHQWGNVDRANRFINAHGDIVRGGLFAGMKLPFEPCFAGYIPMLIGSLEQEIQAGLKRLLDRSPPVLVNVGCAEGYYAVGAAMVNPSMQVYAYDIDPWARRYCRRLAALNGVGDRVNARGW